jgi:hypothetical protein
MSTEMQESWVGVALALPDPFLLLIAQIQLFCYPISSTACRAEKGEIE